MKGKLKVILITMVALLAATGLLLWKLSDSSKKMSKQMENDLKTESDLQEDKKGKIIDSVNSVDIIPLYIAGSKKNVITSNFKNVADVYTVKKSREIEENIANIKKNKICTTDNALWAYNPYGTNRNAMYVYFNTNGNSYCQYTISVQDKSIPDFTRIARGTGSEKVTKNHEYQITGLVPGKKNYITLCLYNSDKELSEKKTYTVTIPKSRVDAPTILNVKKGRSKQKISNGLYVVFSDGKKVSLGKKKTAKKYAILLYDNSGVLRGEIPTDRFIGRNIESVYDTLLFAVDSSKLVQVDSLGKVVKEHSIFGYTMQGEYSYDGYGNVYMIATENKKNATPYSKVIKMELENNKISKMVNMDSLLKPVYKKISKKYKKKNVNWIALNSLQIVGTNQLLVSSKKLSSIFKVNEIGSLTTYVDYIIAPKNQYKGFKSLEKKLLSKRGGAAASLQPTPAPTRKSILNKKTIKPDPFWSQYNQEAMVYSKISNKKYTVGMLNAGLGKESYYYEYKVDENAKNYQLISRLPVHRTRNDGNIYNKNETYFYCCSDENIYVEADKDGKLIRQFSLPMRPYRVYKMDFKKFWFQ